MENVKKQITHNFSAGRKLFYDFMRRIVPRENPKRVMSPASVEAFV